MKPHLKVSDAIRTDLASSGNSRGIVHFFKETKRLMSALIQWIGIAMVDSADGSKNGKWAAKAPVYEMRADYGKLVDTALCLLHEAIRLEIPVTQFQLVKAVYFADKQHLNTYRRPITYDRYRAMKHGPVPMAFYNLLMEDPETLALTGPVQWSRRLVDDVGAYEFFAPLREVDTEWTLSQSDVEELQEALRKVKRLGNAAVWKEVHHDPAYEDAYEENDQGKTFPMSIGLFFSEPDHEQARRISAISRQDYASRRGRPRTPPDRRPPPTDPND